MTEVPFWQVKRFDDMTDREWASLCDGCGRCCLHKLEDAHSGAVVFTSVACRLLNLKSCRCTRYAARLRLVPDCVVLSPDTVDDLAWLPSSCAYRRIAEGRGLAWWHPLVSGDAETVHAAGVSVRGRVVSERQAGEVDSHIVAWPETPA